MSRFDLVELERTHERRSRRMTAADRAPGPLVGSAHTKVLAHVDMCRGALAEVTEIAEALATVVWPPQFVGRATVEGATRGAPDDAARSTFVPLTDDPNWKLRRYTFDAAPGFLVKVIRTTLYLADRPLTAYEIAKAVQQRHAGRWKPRTIRKTVGAPKTGLFVWDLNGVSDDGEPCRRYWLTEPPA